LWIYELNSKFSLSALTHSASDPTAGDDVAVNGERGLRWLFANAAPAAEPPVRYISE
jgi:hypothetical protein